MNLIRLDGDAFRSNTNIRTLIMSYLPGEILFHKLALLNKKTRKMLVTSKGLLDQKKILKPIDCQKAPPDYALKFADCIDLEFGPESDLKKIAQALEAYNLMESDQVEADITVKDLNLQQADSLPEEFGSTVPINNLIRIGQSSIGTIRKRQKVRGGRAFDTVFKKTNIPSHIVTQETNEYIRYKVKCHVRIDAPNLKYLLLEDSPDLIACIKWHSLESLQTLKFVDQCLEDEHFTQLCEMVTEIPGQSLKKIDMVFEDCAPNDIKQILVALDKLESR